jgi:hypothetical protein
MNQKPGDLLLGVIDFFGILIPGAILAFLHGDFILRPLGFSLGELQSPANWIPAFFVSFVLGHFLLGFSLFLNRLAARFPLKTTRAYERAVRLHLKLPPGVPDTPTNVFYSAFSYIRIQSPEAMAELERQAAEYKLFRSLTLLFLLDIPLSIISGSFSLTRLAAALVVVGLAAYRFRWLFDWTYQLAFDFYLQLLKRAPEAKA